MGWLKSNAAAIGIGAAFTMGAIAIVGNRSLGWKLLGASAAAAGALITTQKVKS